MQYISVAFLPSNICIPFNHFITTFHIFHSTYYLSTSRKSIIIHRVHKVLLPLQLNVPRKLYETETSSTSLKVSLHSVHFHMCTSSCPQDVETIFQLHPYTLQHSTTTTIHLQSVVRTGTLVC